MREMAEIEEELSKTITDEPCKWSGMSYTDGVRAALDWALENVEEKPMED